MTASIAGKVWAEASVLAVSVCVLFGPGAGVGADWFLAHWQPEVGLLFPGGQQQHPWSDCDFPWQQHWAVPFRQHEAFPTGTAATAAQPQPNIGIASAGISKAASDTKTRTTIGLRDNIKTRQS